MITNGRTQPEPTLANSFTHFGPTTLTASDFTESHDNSITSNSDGSIVLKHDYKFCSVPF